MLGQVHLLSFAGEVGGDGGRLRECRPMSLSLVEAIAVKSAFLPFLVLYPRHVPVIYLHSSCSGTSLQAYATKGCWQRIHHMPGDAGHARAPRKGYWCTHCMGCRPCEIPRCIHTTGQDPREGTMFVHTRGPGDSGPVRSLGMCKGAGCMRITVLEMQATQEHWVRSPGAYASQAEAAGPARALGRVPGARAPQARCHGPCESTGHA